MNTNESIRTAQAKYDLIGGLYYSQLFDCLELTGFIELNKGEQEDYSQLTAAITQVIKKTEQDPEMAEKKGNEIDELVMAYGNSREEDGFRMGFHVAMRMCMEGLSRP